MYIHIVRNFCEGLINIPRGESNDSVIIESWNGMTENIFDYLLDMVCNQFVEEMGRFLGRSDSLSKCAM